MSETSFGFQWTAASLVISIIAMISVCVLSWFVWKRSGFRPAVLPLEILRIILVGFAVFLLNQPESVEEFKPSEKPTVVVLGDESLSMNTQDVGLEGSESTPLLTRLKAIKPLMDPETWSDLTEDTEIVISPFASGESSSKSDLHEAFVAVDVGGHKGRVVGGVFQKTHHVALHQI